jgi:nucleoside-diphosphate-sugar epimerase
VIIRPTNVWGRWHLRYPYEFWKIVRDGKYFHPGSKVVMRSYGYVGNVCEQILKLIDLRDSQSVSKKIFYVGDEPINLYNWVNSFSLAITKKKARIVPTAVVYSLAVFGSILQKLKVSFPITISRYKSMTSENPAPMEKTIKILGCPKYSMQQGVEITTTWLSEFWKTNKV